MNKEIETKTLTKKDWCFIRAILNSHINHLNYRGHVYSKTCPATGAGSDKELIGFIEDVRDRMSTKRQSAVSAKTGVKP